MIYVCAVCWRIPFGLPQGCDEQVSWRVGVAGQRGGRGEGVQGARGEQQQAGDAEHGGGGVTAGATERLVFLRYVPRIYAGEPVLSDYTVLQMKQERF